MVCFMQKGVSVLDSSFLASGDIFSEGAVDISGRFIGDIVAESISVKKGGNIEGEIYANELTIADGGIIKGNILAKKIKVLKDAEIEGDIEYCCLAIEDGAKIIGSFSVIAENVVAEKINSAKSSLNIAGTTTHAKKDNRKNN